MPMFKVDYKVSGKMKELSLAADNIDDAREQVLAKHPGATITGVRQKGGYTPPAGGAAPGKKKSSSLLPILVILLVLLILGVGAVAFTLGMIQI